MRVRKAVIPAAGLGTRFLPATKAQPKEMLPIVDKPAIQYVVEEAVASGCDDLLIVTGKDKRAIEDHFDRCPELEAILAQRGKFHLLALVQVISGVADVHYIRQKEPLGLGHAVWCARRHVGDEPFAVLLGDDLVRADPPCLAQMIAQYERYRAPVIAVERVPEEEVSAYGVVAAEPIGDRVYAVRDLVEKPAVDRAPSNLAIIGRYVLEPDVFRLLEAQEPGVGGEVQLTDALRALNRSRPLIAYEFVGRRHDVGTPLGYLRATIELALEREDLRDALRAHLRDLALRPPAPAGPRAAPPADPAAASPGPGD